MWMWPTYRPLRDIAYLLPNELVQPPCGLGIARALVVVLSAVIKDKLGVADEVFGRGVEILFVLFIHGGQVHGLFDDVVVVEDVVLVCGVLEGPGVGGVMRVV